MSRENLQLILNNFRIYGIVTYSEKQIQIFHDLPTTRYFDIQTESGKFLLFESTWKDTDCEVFTRVLKDKFQDIEKVLSEADKNSEKVSFSDKYYSLYRLI